MTKGAQITFIEEVIDLINIDNGSVHFRSKDKTTLIAIKGTIQASIEDEDRRTNLLLNQLNDYSLDACIAYTRDLRNGLHKELAKLSNGSIEYLGTQKQMRMMGAIEENLVAMRTFAERMTEELLRMPGNQPEEVDNQPKNCACDGFCTNACANREEVSNG